MSLDRSVQSRISKAMILRNVNKDVHDWKKKNSKAENNVPFRSTTRLFHRWPEFYSGYCRFSKHWCTKYPQYRVYSDYDSHWSWLPNVKLFEKWECSQSFMFQARWKWEWGGDCSLKGNQRPVARKVYMYIDDRCIVGEVPVDITVCHGTFPIRFKGTYCA